MQKKEVQKFIIFILAIFLVIFNNCSKFQPTNSSPVTSDYSDTQSVAPITVSQGVSFLSTSPPAVAAATNSSSVPIAMNWTSLRANYAAGGVGQVTPGKGFGAASVASTSAVYLMPPESSADFAKLTFPLAFQPGLTWYLNYQAGILTALDAGAPVTMHVIVSGAALFSPEAPWQVIHTDVIYPGQTINISLPLGLWSLRSGFSVSFQVQKNSSIAGQPMVVLNNLNIASSIALPEQGLGRSNLMWSTDTERNVVVSGVSALGAKWFRDGFRSGDEAAIVDLVSRVKSLKMKMLLTVMQDVADYDSVTPYVYGGTVFQNVCGWSNGALPLSTINYTKFKDRIRSHLTALKSAGLSVDAFEIGNEFDWVCFNGDIPFGAVATRTQKELIAKSYAWLLAEAVSVIHDAAFYPDAKIITFGMANIPANFRPGYHLDDPGYVLSMLSNIDGTNFLDNANYHVDGIGMHLYPSSTNVGPDALKILSANDQYLRAIGKPYWITEWGFPRSQFSNSQARAQAMLDFLNVLVSQYGQFTFGPQFFYAYNSPNEVNTSGNHEYALVDAKYARLLEADVFYKRYRW